jgi:hypothetical protein
MEFCDAFYAQLARYEHKVIDRKITRYTIDRITNHLQPACKVTIKEIQQQNLPNTTP